MPEAASSVRPCRQPAGRISDRRSGFAAGDVITHRLLIGHRQALRGHHRTACQIHHPRIGPAGIGGPHGDREIAGFLRRAGYQPAARIERHPGRQAAQQRVKPGRVERADLIGKRLAAGTRHGIGRGDDRWRNDRLIGEGDRRELAALQDDHLRVGGTNPATVANCTV